MVAVFIVMAADAGLAGGREVARFVAGADQVTWRKYTELAWRFPDFFPLCRASRQQIGEDAQIEDQNQEK